VKESPNARKIRTIWDRCYDFKNILPKNSADKLAFLTQNKAKLRKNFDHNIGV
jgi:hypothetical protein